MSKIRKFTAQRMTDMGHTVTVMGVQHEVKKQHVTNSNPTSKHKGCQEMVTTIRTRREQQLHLVIAIQHPDDTYNPEVAYRILARRLKRKQFHMSINSFQFMGSDFCQAIVDAEADYIAKNVKDFVKKVRNYKK